MKSLMWLWQEALLDRSAWCGTSTTRDLETATGRFEHEGESFLTITLPAFGKDLEKALDLQQADRSLFAGFQRKGELPRFLGGFLDLVFDRSTGRLLDDPSVDAIQALRQLTLMCGKVELACSDARRSKALASFIECEQSVREFDKQRTPQEYLEFQRMSNLLLGRVFSALENDLLSNREVFTPKHGPGGTADRFLGNRKYHQSEWTTRLDQVFPHGEFLVPSMRYTREGVLDHVTLLEPGAERPVRVISVPKTLKTPRIIALEPVAMQYSQQAIMEQLVKRIEGSDTLSPLVGFTDQDPNRDLARQGSITGNLATLDLSEASDRVSNQLVKTMLSWTPLLEEAVDATRSRSADVPGHGVVRLAKFASMGSALCFPVEATVFLTLIFLGIQDALNRPVTMRDVKSMHGKVRVYGDDIIVPVEYVSAVVARLEAFGLKVNGGKSFWTGKFRESCGREYYAGEDVSIVRVRALLPTSRTDAAGVISMTSFRNQCYHAGLWGVARYVDKYASRLIPWPTVSCSSPALGRHSYLGFIAERIEGGKSMQRPLVKGVSARTILPRNSVANEFALLKCFLRRDADDNLPVVDKKHLERSGRPDSVTLKVGWLPAC